MKIRTVSLGKFASVVCISVLSCFSLNAVRADYLVAQGPDPFAQWAYHDPCCYKHRVIKKPCGSCVCQCKRSYKKLYRCYTPPAPCHRVSAYRPCCRPCCPGPGPVHETVSVGPGCCYSRHVAYEEYYYAPDLATGDDDPIYDPDMNIDK